MSTPLKDLYKQLSHTNDLEVEVSEKGVLHVDTKRLLETDTAKQQIEAMRRLESSHPLVRPRKIA
jgi:hypothetical protein